MSAGSKPRRSSLVGELLRGNDPKLPASEPLYFDPLTLPLPALESLHGCFANGYTPEDISAVAAKIKDELGGLRLCCLWDYCDRWGAGGDSELFLCDGPGRMFALPDPLLGWLFGEQDDQRRLRSFLHRWRSEMPPSSLHVLGFHRIDKRNLCRKYAPEVELG